MRHELVTAPVTLRNDREMLRRRYLADLSGERPHLRGSAVATSALTETIPE